MKVHFNSISTMFMFNKRRTRCILGYLYDFFLVFTYEHKSDNTKQRWNQPSKRSPQHTGSLTANHVLVPVAVQVLSAELGSAKTQL